MDEIAPWKEPKTWEDALFACQKKPQWEEFMKWGQAADLLLEKSGIGKESLKKAKLIKNRNVLNTAFKDTRSPGLELLEAVIFGTGHTWHDWAHANFLVSCEEKPNKDYVKLNEESKELMDRFHARFQDRSDTQAIEKALTYYVGDLEELGMDKKTWLPKEKPVKPHPQEHLHAAEKGSQYGKPPKLKKV